MKVLYFSTVNWKWIKQRPHFLCEYLSDNNIDITYFSITPFLKQSIINEKINESLFINDKFVLPYASKLGIIKKINILYVKFLLNKKYDVIILTHPEQYEYLPSKIKKTAKIVYECMDNIPYFYEGNKINKIEECEKKLCENVDYIISSSTYLKDKIVNKYNIEANKIEIIKNALDKSLVNKRESLIDLKSPNLMYIGTVDKWFDIESLKKYADDNPEVTIYVIGPVENKLGRFKRKNIIFLGTIKHEDVPNYIKSGDIMLIPFKVNQLIEGVDPVKLYEYLAFNKPVVTSYWNELEEYKNNDLVYFYKDYAQFKSTVDSIKSNINNFNEVNSDFIKGNTWEERGKCYLDILKNHIYNRRKE